MQKRSAGQASRKIGEPRSEVGRGLEIEDARGACRGCGVVMVRARYSGARSLAP